MEFKQYGGLLTDWMLLSLASSIAFVWYGSYLWLGMGGGWKSLLIALGAALATAVLSRLAILVEIRGRGGSSGDMIIMDGEGVRLKQKGEVSLSIAWEDITAITHNKEPPSPPARNAPGQREPWGEPSLVPGGQKFTELYAGAAPGTGKAPEIRLQIEHKGKEPERGERYGYSCYRSGICGCEGIS